MKTKGDKARGEVLFTQAGCVACHTVKATDPAKGPYLGNIAETYKRRELAEAILIPNKTIAQGFVTNTFTMKDGSVQMGFVTQEAADKVVIRNIAAQEFTIDPKLVAKREKNEAQSLMPVGLMNASTVADLASLIDYLESLAKK
jgi:putative heme-binding domain-containing protein